MRSLGNGIRNFYGSLIISSAPGYAGASITGASSLTAPQLGIIGSSGAAGIIGFTDGQSGNHQYAMGSGLGGAGLFTIYDTTNSAVRMQLGADGGFTIGVPSGGDQGVGTLNIQNGLYVAGQPIYAGIPQNAQPNNYTMVLSDASKSILHNSASSHTYTVPANASVPYPLGTAITIVNGGAGGTITLAITSDTFQFFPSGATGSRTMAPYSQVTILKVTTTVWSLTGVGVT